MWPLALVTLIVKPWKTHLNENAKPTLIKFQMRNWTISIIRIWKRSVLFAVVGKALNKSQDLSWPRRFRRPGGGSLQKRKFGIQIPHASQAWRTRTWNVIRLGQPRFPSPPSLLYCPFRVPILKHFCTHEFKMHALFWWRHIGDQFLKRKEKTYK